MKRQRLPLLVVVDANPPDASKPAHSPHSLEPLSAQLFQHLAGSDRLTRVVFGTAPVAKDEAGFSGTAPVDSDDRNRGTVLPRAGLWICPRPRNALEREGTAVLSLENGGDAYGEPIRSKTPITCAGDWLRDLRDILAALWMEHAAEVRLNSPEMPIPGPPTPFGGIPWMRIQFAEDPHRAWTDRPSPAVMQPEADRLLQAWRAWCQVRGWVGS